jgi:hypothetical protein
LGRETGWVQTVYKRIPDSHRLDQHGGWYVLLSEHLRNDKKRPRPDASDGEGTGEGEDIEQEPEAAAANSSDPSVAKRNK